jgi:hypothetical protein
MALHVQFLNQIRQYVRAQDSDNLRAWLQVHPNSSASYYNLQKELKAQRPRDGDLDAVIEQSLPIDYDDDNDGSGAVWPGFQAFMKDYFHFWRDVNFEDLAGAHQLLSNLVKYAEIHDTREVGSLTVASAHATRPFLTRRRAPSCSRRHCRCLRLSHSSP